MDKDSGFPTKKTLLLFNVEVKVTNNKPKPKKKKTYFLNGDILQRGIVNFYWCKALGSIKDELFIDGKMCFKKKYSINGNFRVVWPLSFLFFTWYPNFCNIKLLIKL